MGVLKGDTRSLDYGSYYPNVTLILPQYNPNLRRGNRQVVLPLSLQGEDATLGKPPLILGLYWGNIRVILG